MTTSRRVSKNQVVDGQLNLQGDIEGLENLVNKPTVVEVDGLKVIQIVIPKKEVETKGYVDTALALARKLQPEVKSKGKPPWLDAQWQAKRRKAMNG